MAAATVPRVLSSGSPVNLDLFPAAALSKLFWLSDEA